MVVRLPRVLFMASHATQLVVRIVEVFNSCLITAHSQLKVRVCNFWKKKIHVFFFLNLFHHMITQISVTVPQFDVHKWISETNKN